MNALSDAEVINHLKTLTWETLAGPPLTGSEAFQGHNEDFTVAVVVVTWPLPDGGVGCDGTITLPRAGLIQHMTRLQSAQAAELAHGQK